MRKLLAAVALCGLVCTSVAKTTTWTGNAGTTDISTAGNWDNGAPEPGDTVQIKQTATLEGSFDLGSVGLRIENSVDMTSKVVFSGSGMLTKAGSKTLTIEGSKWTGFSGKIRVENGTFRVNVSQRNMFGTGSFELLASAVPSNNSLLKLDKNPTYIDEPINIIGSLGDGVMLRAIHAGNPTTINGKITSSVDFYLGIGYGDLSATGGIEAPGRTVTCDVDQYGVSAGICNLSISGTVNASLKKIRFGRLLYSGQSTNAASTLTIDTDIDSSKFAVKTNELTANSTWAGDIVVKGATSILAISAAKNVSPNAALTVRDGAKLKLAQNRLVCVRSLTLGVEAQDTGVHRAATHPDYFTTADGSVAVLGGAVRETVTWVGGARGAIADGTNWSPRCPQPGDVLRFTKAVTLTSTDALPTEDAQTGKSGYVVDIDAYNVVFSNALAGAGALTVVGESSGVFQKCAYWPDFTGDVNLFNGTFEDRPLKPESQGQLGTGTIRLYVTSPTRPKFHQARYATTLLNAIEIKGDLPMTGAAITVGDVTYFNGKVTSEVDCKLDCLWGQMTFNGGFSAPGKTVSLNSDNDSTLKGFSFPSVCKLDCSLVKTGKNPLVLTAYSDSAIASNVTLTVNGGTATIDAACRFPGRAIAVNGTGSVVNLKNGKTLDGTPELAVSDGGLVKVDAGKGFVDAFSVDGVALADGAYTKARRPDVLDGNGSIRVGHPGIVVIFR